MTLLKYAAECYVRIVRKPMKMAKYLHIALLNSTMNEIFKQEDVKKKQQTTSRKTRWRGSAAWLANFRNAPIFIWMAYVRLELSWVLGIFSHSNSNIAQWWNSTWRFVRSSIQSNQIATFIFLDYPLDLPDRKYRRWVLTFLSWISSDTDKII